MLVHNVYYDTGANAQLQHAKIGRHYSLPCVSMQSSIYPELLAGRIKNRDITEDDLHPNDKGHELVADTVCHFLKKVLDHVDDPEEAVPNPEQIRFIWYPLSVLMFNCCSIRERRKNE